MMNCMRFLSIHFFSLTKSFWKASLPYPYQLLPTPFSVIHKLAEDALLSIVQVANDNMEQYESQY